MQQWLNPDTPATAEFTLLALLRHGKTVWNEAGRIQGLQDSPLSRQGREQVADWADFLKNFTIDQIVASDLGRVRETAAIICRRLPDVPIEWNPLLREQHWGEWEGRTFHDLKKEQGEALASQIRSGWDFRPPGGESRSEVLQRVLPALLEISEKHIGKRILVICHEGIIKTTIYHLAGRAFLPEEKKLLHKRDLHLLQVVEKKLSIARLNIMTTLGKTAATAKGQP